MPPEEDHHDENHQRGTGRPRHQGAPGRGRARDQVRSRFAHRPPRRADRRDRRGAGRTPAQIALAWLLSQGDDIVPIPGTTRIDRLEENAAADRISLADRQIARLGTLTPATGDRYDPRSLSGWGS
ncbi:aldo/keto reductase [Actinoplanes palleronii]|uniref:aldo/keto reductase n=1 Tax=Actinoplanes palleronii TaxID=113570 RepID=UPI001943B616